MMTSFRDKLFKSFEQCRVSGTLVDFEVRLGSGEKFPLHRIILSAASRTIRQALDSNPANVVVDGCTPGGFQHFVDYVYREELSFTEDSVHEALQAAHALQSPDFEDACIKEILLRINNKTCLKYFKAATTPDLHLVREKALRYLRYNLVSVAKDDVFSSVSDTELVEIINHESTKSNNRTYDVFLICIKWCMDNPEVEPMDIIEKIDIDELDSNELKTLLKHEFVKDRRNIEVKVHLLEARHKILEEVATSEKTPTSQSEDTPNDCASSQRTLLVGVAEDGQHLHVIRDVNSNEDVSGDVAVESGMISDKHTQCVAVGDVIFFIGGDRTNTLTSYNISTNTWTTLQPTRTPGRWRALCVLAGDIVTVGGLHLGDCSAAADRYVIREDKWFPFTDHPVEAAARSACEVAGKLIVCGGWRPDLSQHSPIYQYDMDTERWRLIGEMLTERFHHFTCGLQDRMYVVGDRIRREPFVEVFDLQTGQSSAVVQSDVTMNTSTFTRVVCRATNTCIYIHDPGTDDVYELTLKTGVIVKHSVNGLGPKNVLDIRMLKLAVDD